MTAAFARHFISRIGDGRIFARLAQLLPKGIGRAYFAIFAFFASARQSPCRTPASVAIAHRTAVLRAHTQKPWRCNLHQ